MIQDTASEIDPSDLRVTVGSKSLALPKKKWKREDETYTEISQKISKRF